MSLGTQVGLRVIWTLLVTRWSNCPLDLKACATFIPLCASLHTGMMGGIMGSRWILTFLLCLHFLFSVAGGEQLQGCSGTPSMAFLEAFAFAWEVLESHLFFQHFLCSWHAFYKWSHLGLSSGSADFPYMLLCLGSPLHCGYYVKVGASSSMTLSCCCREIQKWSCFPGLTGRQTGSSHLNWMVSSFNKKRRRKLLKVAGAEGRLSAHLCTFILLQVTLWSSTSNHFPF